MSNSNTQSIDGQPSDQSRFDVQGLSHIELLTPNPDGTLWFFKDVLGLIELKREGQSVYLRTFKDVPWTTLKVTEAPEPGLGHAGWVTTSKEALDRRVTALEDSGYGEGWIDGDIGHGPAYQFSTPEGHSMEIHWEVEKARDRIEQDTQMINQPQQRPDKGITPDRLDHLNVLAKEPDDIRQFMQDSLGLRLVEMIELSDGSVGGTWQTSFTKHHELATTNDRTGHGGRTHHVAWYFRESQHVLDLCDQLRENNIQIEVGPGKHGISQSLFLYLYEPGGNRIEGYSQGYSVQDMNWDPIVWKEDEYETNWWGKQTPEDFYVYGTPPVEEQEGFGPDWNESPYRETQTQMASL